jgi:hypothetical protein
MPKEMKSKVKRNKVAPRTKDIILQKFCNEEQLNIIKKQIKAGAVFIVLGSEFTDTDMFYKGLMQLMYAPTSNGACTYDSYVKFRYGFDRPIITISLNDRCNHNKVYSIKQLRRYKTLTLYANHEEA